MQRVLVAKDKSINHITKFKRSFVESRYVRRKPHYISTYVSSHNGCRMGCKFCWLTQQKQEEFNHTPIQSTPESYNEQLVKILSNVPDEHKSLEQLHKVRVNVNFMARGEALANRYVVNQYPLLWKTLNDTTKRFGYDKAILNISTIMPKALDTQNRSLYSIFGNTPVRLYYSMYSINETWKTQWMPNAMPYSRALDKLAEYQHSVFSTHEKECQLPLTFHWAFIKGQNDNPEDVYKLVQEINKRRFWSTRFNLVRFNAGSLKHQEPDLDHLNALFDIIQQNLNGQQQQQSALNLNTSRIVDRVGSDAYVSCGMFVDDKHL